MAHVKARLYRGSVRREPGSFGGLCRGCGSPTGIDFASSPIIQQALIIHKYREDFEVNLGSCGQASFCFYGRHSGDLTRRCFLLAVFHEKLWNLWIRVSGGAAAQRRQHAPADTCISSELVAAGSMPSSMFPITAPFPCRSCRLGPFKMELGSSPKQ